MRWIGMAALGALIMAGCPMASAATVDVTASNYMFTPSTVTINQGDTVDFSNPSAGYHNVDFADGSFQMPMSPTPSMWSSSKTFLEPGTYSYFCDAHKSVGMTGTVVVNPATSGGGGGTPPPAPGPLANLAPAVASLGGPSRQHVGWLFVRASMNEAGTLAATGTVSVPARAARIYRFKPVRRPVSANQLVRLRLRLSKHSRHSLRRALRRHRLRANVAVTATDITGGKTIRRITVRLSR